MKDLGEQWVLSYLFNRKLIVFLSEVFPLLPVIAKIFALQFSLLSLANSSRKVIELSILIILIGASLTLIPEKIIFLRGAQEEMFLKLLQLQTAPNPHDIVKWMFEHGVDATIKSYGFNIEELLQVSMQGTMPISKWTSRLNSPLLSQPGHNQYFSNLKHAAYTNTKKILFLNRGVDISRPLSAQNDCFWWGYQNFSLINKPYSTFKRIVRGYQSNENNDLEHSKNRILCTLFKQPLENKKILAGIFSKNGDIIELFESK